MSISSAVGNTDRQRAYRARTKEKCKLAALAPLLAEEVVTLHKEVARLIEENTALNELNEITCSLDEVSQ